MHYSPPPWKHPTTDLFAIWEARLLRGAVFLLFLLALGQFVWHEVQRIFWH